MTIKEELIAGVDDLINKKIKELAFDIIVEKNVVIEIIKTCNNVNAYNFACKIVGDDVQTLTQEEYDLLKELVR